MIDVCIFCRLDCTRSALGPILTWVSSASQLGIVWKDEIMVETYVFVLFTYSQYLNTSFIPMPTVDNRPSKTDVLPCACSPHYVIELSARSGHGVLPDLPYHPLGPQALESSNITRMVLYSNHQNRFENSTTKITVKSPKGSWVNLKTT